MPCFIIRTYSLVDVYEYLSVRAMSAGIFISNMTFPFLSFPAFCVIPIGMDSGDSISGILLFINLHSESA